MVRTAAEPAKADVGVDDQTTSAVSDGLRIKQWEPDRSPLQFVRSTAAFPPEDHERSGDDRAELSPQRYASTVGNAALSVFHNGGLAAATTGALAVYHGRVFGPYQGSADVIRSIWVTQAQIDEVGEEYIQFLSDNRLSISLAFVGFMSAEMASGVLAKSEKTRWAAGVIQFLLFKFSAPGVVISVDATLEHAGRWLHLASTAHLNPATRDWQRNEASKAYLQMWVSFLMACLAAGATLRNLANAVKLWRVPGPLTLPAPMRAALDDPTVLPTTQRADGSFHVPVEPQPTASAPTASRSVADALPFKAVRGNADPVWTGLPAIPAWSVPSVPMMVPLRALDVIPQAAAVGPVLTGRPLAATSPVGQTLGDSAYDKRSPVIQSGVDVVSYVWPTLRFRGGGSMDARYVTARIRGQDYFVLSIDADAKSGVFLAMDADARRVIYDQKLEEVSFVAPIGGGAPDHNLIPLSEQRGLPTASVSKRREGDKRALLTRTARYERHGQFGFSELASFTHPNIIAEVVNFLSSPERVASRLLQLQDEVTNRYNTVHRDSHILVLEVLADVETRNGFLPSSKVDLDFRLIFHGALSLEMAHNPRQFPVAGKDPVLPSVIVGELLSQWSHALHPTAPYRVLAEFGEFVRGYHHPAVRTTEPTQRISPWLPLYRHGGSRALAQMQPAVREVFELFVRNHDVTTDSMQAVLSRWQSTVGRGYIPSIDEAIAEIATVLRRAAGAAENPQFDTIEPIVDGTTTRYRYQVTNPNGKRWYSVQIHGERYLLYMKAEYFEVLRSMIEARGLNSSAMVDVYRRSLGKAVSAVRAFDIKDAIDNALEHAVRVAGEPNGEVHPGSIKGYKGDLQEYVYRVESLDPVETSRPPVAPIGQPLLELKQHTYDIDGDRKSLRLRPLPHKVFERLIQNYNRDRASVEGPHRGFTTEAQLIELLTPELPGQSNDQLRTELAKIVENQIARPLRQTKIGTIRPVDANGQHGYLFQASVVVEPMTIEGRKVWADFLPQDRPLMERLVIGKLDTRAIRSHFEEWNRLHPDRHAAQTDVVEKFVLRATYALGHGRLSEHGPPVSIGWIRATKSEDDKTYIYEFRSAIVGKSGKDELPTGRLEKSVIPAGNGNVTLQEQWETIEANVIDSYLKAAKGDILALNDLLAVVASPPRRVYRTADTPAAAHIWQLVNHGPPEIRERALQGLENILTALQANSNTLSYILRRVPKSRSPKDCLRLVQLGLGHPHLEVQRAAIRSTKIVADRGSIEFLQLWRTTARQLWRLNTLWEAGSPKSLTALRKILMANNTHVHVQSFIINLASEHAKGNYELVAAALGHANPDIRRKAAEITLDWVAAEDSRFSALWEKKAPEELKPWFASELEKRTKETIKRQKRKDPVD